MKVLAIAHQTLIELWRQKTAWGFLVIALLLALPAVLPLGGLVINGKQAIGVGIVGGILNVTQFIALFLTISLASSLIPSDREQGMLLLLTTKPMARYQVLLGKGLGAGLWMFGAWLSWGVILGLALSIKLGTSLLIPTLLGFVASGVASWLVIAFCLFLSTMLAANATTGLAILSWFGAASAPKLAGILEALGHHGAARALETVGWLLPVGPLSQAARGLANSEPPGVHAWLGTGVILVWWGAASWVFSSRDLSAGS